MKLAKSLFWKTRPDNRENVVSASTAGAAAPIGHSSAETNNVIRLPVGNPSVPAGEAAAALEIGTRSLQPRPTPRGLLDDPALASFFAENYFGCGRYTGARYKSADFLRRGRAELLANFQRAIETVTQQRVATGNRLHSELLAIEGVSSAVSARISLAIQQVERDISVLTAQLDASKSEQGLVVEALRRYEAGFAQGVADSLSFDLLAGGE